MQIWSSVYNRGENKMESGYLTSLHHRLNVINIRNDHTNKQITLKPLMIFP